MSRLIPHPADQFSPSDFGADGCFVARPIEADLYDRGPHWIGACGEVHKPGDCDAPECQSDVTEREES